MFGVCARNYHSYTHLLLALSVVREPTVWGFITSKYSCTKDIGRTSLYVVSTLKPEPQHKKEPLFRLVSLDPGGHYQDLGIASHKTFV